MKHIRTLPFEKINQKTISINNFSNCYVKKIRKDTLELNLILAKTGKKTPINLLLYLIDHNVKPHYQNQTK